MIIDVNAWTGPWPALVNVPHDVASVRSSLREYGVERVFMASLAAVWSTNPHLCNTVVYEAADEFDDISPVPVIDPTLPTWPEELEKAAGHHAVGMIKLQPGYGGYDLAEVDEAVGDGAVADGAEADESVADMAVVDELLEAARRASLVVMVQVRIDDPRRHHPKAQVPDVPVRDVVEAAERHADLKLVIGGASAAALKDLAPQICELPGLYADTSQVDGVDGVRGLVDAGLGGKLLFGSHAPVFMPSAAVARVVNDLPDEVAKAILRENAARLMWV